MALVAGESEEKGSCSFYIEASLWVLESTGCANIRVLLHPHYCGPHHHSCHFWSSHYVSGSMIGTLHALSYRNFPQTLGHWHSHPHFTNEDTEVNRILWLAWVIQLVSGRKELEASSSWCTTSVLTPNMLFLAVIPLLPPQLQHSAKCKSIICSADYYYDCCFAQPMPGLGHCFPPKIVTKIRYPASLNSNPYSIDRWNKTEISYWMNDGSK